MTGHGRGPSGPDTGQASNLTADMSFLQLPSPPPHTHIHTACSGVSGLTQVTTNPRPFLPTGSPSGLDDPSPPQVIIPSQGLKATQPDTQSLGCCHSAALSWIQSHQLPLHGVMVPIPYKPGKVLGLLGVCQAVLAELLSTMAGPGGLRPTPPRAVLHSALGPAGKTGRALRI
jgi:hypothetical protein